MGCILCEPVPRHCSVEFNFHIKSGLGKYLILSVESPHMMIVISQHFWSLNFSLLNQLCFTAILREILFLNHYRLVKHNLCHIKKKAFVYRGNNL